MDCRFIPRYLARIGGDGARLTTSAHRIRPLRGHTVQE